MPTQKKVFFDIDYPNAGQVGIHKGTAVHVQFNEKSGKTVIILSPGAECTIGIADVCARGPIPVKGSVEDVKKRLGLTK